jgi:hypothetical protein
VTQSDPLLHAQLLHRRRRTAHLADLVHLGAARVGALGAPEWSSPAADSYRSVLLGVREALSLAESDLRDAVDLLEQATIGAAG